MIRKSEKKIQFFVVFKQKVWSRIRKRRFEAKREKALSWEPKNKRKKRPKHIFLVSKEIERDSKYMRAKKKSNSESFIL